VDLTRLGTGHRIAAGAAVLLFIDSWLLDWYGVNGLDGGVSAWTAFSITDLLILLTVVVAIGAAVLHLQNLDGATPIPPPLAVVGVAGYTTLIILYRIVNEPHADNLIDVKFGAYLGFVLCALVAFGGFKALNEGSSSTVPASRG
jgi:hypothetical protein